MKTYFEYLNNYNVGEKAVQLINQGYNYRDNAIIAEECDADNFTADETSAIIAKMFLLEGQALHPWIFKVVQRDFYNVRGLRYTDTDEIELLGASELETDIISWILWDLEDSEKYQ